MGIIEQLDSDSADLLEALEELLESAGKELDQSASLRGLANCTTLADAREVVTQLRDRI